MKTRMETLMHNHDETTIHAYMHPYIYESSRWNATTATEREIINKILIQK